MIIKYNIYLLNYCRPLQGFYFVNLIGVKVTEFYNNVNVLFNFLEHDYKLTIYYNSDNNTIEINFYNHPSGKKEICCKKSCFPNYQKEYCIFVNEKYFDLIIKHKELLLC